MGKTGKFFKITPEKWAQIKKLSISNSFTQGEIAKILDVSKASVSNASRAATYEEYQAIVRTASAIARKKKQEEAEEKSGIKELYKAELESVKKGEITPIYTEAQLDRIIELLVENNKKLTQLTELWGMPKAEEQNNGYNGYKPF